ncbi:MAG: hypothetical protein L0K86_25265 [Actinomycetia bacterium]|nr:hypothetical protein [Actinomycetes bacterium]
MDDAARADPEQAVIGLGRALERTIRKVDALDAAVRALAADVRAVAPAAPVPTDAEPEGLRSWLLAVDTDLGTAALADLAAWLGRVYLQFDRTSLASCWLWHPAIVEELWWLRCAHADAYDPQTGSWLRVGDWHDRLRPGVLSRVNGVLNKCALSRHADRNGRPTEVLPPLPPPLARHHAAIADAWTTTTTVPTPTPDQIAEADQYDDQRFRGHHR